VNKTWREFTPDFKQEAVALLRSSVRPLTQIAPADLAYRRSRKRAFSRAGAEAMRDAFTIIAVVSAVLIPRHLLLLPPCRDAAARPPPPRWSSQASMPCCD
jgi:hypothetical protein